MQSTTKAVRLATAIAILGTGPVVGCSTDLQGAADAASAVGSCATLVIADSTASLDGYSRFLPDEKKNNPMAGDPSYVYLAAGKEAVVIAGPDVTSASGLFTLMDPSIDLVGATDTVAQGYTVTVNSQLGYRVAIDDFEYEVALAHVELCEVSQVIASRFVFRGNPGAGGVAHDIIITAAVGATLSAPTSPVTVEVR